MVVMLLFVSTSYGQVLMVSSDINVDDKNRRSNIDFTREIND